MAYINGEDRYQTTFLVTCIDDFVDENNPVRAIDAFVNVLDLERLGFITYDDNKPGQCPYDRKQLLKLHIYGYMNGIRSSRKLETESKRNIELMWLINKLTPDHGTISSFVKDNKKAFRQVLKEFSLILKGWGLIDGKLVAIDGTKLRAVNSKKNHITLETLNKKIKYIESQIDEYMKQLEDKNDSNINEAIATEIEVKEIEEKIMAYKNKKDEIEKMKEDMNSKGINQICTTDPDSRGMKNNGKSEVCYNVQTAVDSKHCLIIDCEVVNDTNDLNQLSNMSFNVKKTLKKRKLKVVADTGYYNFEQIKTCVDKKVTVYIKKAKSNNKTGNDEYRKEKFVYNPKADKYICPEGKDLLFESHTSKDGVKYKRYKGTECQNCPKKNLCTAAKEGRTIQRWVHEEILEEVEKDTIKNSEIYKSRKCIVEHPFGTIKRMLNYTYFTRKGLISVNAEAASIFVAYNLKRIINILTVPKLVSKISQLCY